MEESTPQFEATPVRAHVRRPRQKKPQGLLAFILSLARTKYGKYFGLAPKRRTRKPKVQA